MLNTKLILSNFSVQGLLLPRSSFNLLPNPTNDFFPIHNFSPFNTMVIHRENAPAIGEAEMEYGGRATLLLGGWDFSTFDLNYFDRDPYYKIGPETTNSNLELQEQHSRVQTYGATLSKDFGFTVLRFEGLKTEHKILPLLTSSGVSNVMVSDLVYAIGLDFPTISEYIVSAQWSQDSIGKRTPGLVRSPLQSLLSLRLQGRLIGQNEIELLGTKNVADGGSRLLLSYAVPLNQRLESKLGIEFFDGPSDSDFGKIRTASRAFFILKNYIKDK